MNCVVARMSGGGCVAESSVKMNFESRLRMKMILVSCDDDRDQVDEDRQAGSDDAICTGDEGQGRVRNLNE